MAMWFPRLWRRLEDRQPTAWIIGGRKYTTNPDSTAQMLWRQWEFDRTGERLLYELWVKPATKQRPVPEYFQVHGPIDRLKCVPFPSEGNAKAWAELSQMPPHIYERIWGWVAE